MRKCVRMAALRVSRPEDREVPVVLKDVGADLADLVQTASRPEDRAVLGDLKDVAADPVDLVQMVPAPEVLVAPDVVPVVPDKAPWGHLIERPPA